MVIAERKQPVITYITAPGAIAMSMLRGNHFAGHGCLLNNV
jgi:hypothetical protein